MTDSAGSADAVQVDATVVESKPKENSDARRFLGMVTYGIVAIFWYSLIRMAVLAGIALLWWIIPTTHAQFGAAIWMLFVQPIGLAVGAYLTMLTNVRNRPFHTAIAFVVFASVFIGHISWPVGNPYVVKAPDGLRITAAFVQGIAILIAALIGFYKTRPKDLKIPKMLLPPKAKRSA